jgi:hypothetical protein
MLAAIGVVKIESVWKLLMLCILFPVDTITRVVGLLPLQIAGKAHLPNVQVRNFLEISL